MQEHTDQSKDNYYPLDVESGAEMVRLLDQGTTMTEAMGGLFPERSSLDGIFDVLDIGCGPGEWVHEVAHTYPEIEITGVDLSESMIRYAEAHAKVRGLTNAHFRVMNANQPLDFPDASFDLVNVRTAFGFIPAVNWPAFLTECKRILRPGGVLRWSEGDWGETNKRAVETFLGLTARVSHLSGLGFSPSGRSLGIVPLMNRLLRTTGFEHIQNKPHMMDASYGTNLHEGSYQDIKILVQTFSPVFTKMGLISQEQMDELAEQVLTEMQLEDYCHVGLMLTAWAQKPA